MIKVGLLGLGTIGKVHLDAYNRAIAENDDVRLEACFDITKENMDGIGDIRKYTDIDSFFEKEKGKLDFIDICLPTFMHREVAIRAMNNGFNVLCEKPMALNTEDATAMYEVSKKTGKTLMIAHVLRFSYHFNIINEYIKNKTLGDVRNIKYTNYITGLPSGHNDWLKNTKLSGGPAIDFHAHDIDLLMWYFGKPQSLSTVGNRDMFSTNIVYEDGFYANFQCDFAVASTKHDGGRSIRINFENGYIIKDNFNFIAVDSEGNKKNLAEGCAMVTSYEDPMYYNEIKYFSRSIANNTTTDVCPLEESLFVIKFIESELKSAENSGGLIIFN